MIESWKTFLLSQGAVIENGTVQHYGNAAAERAAADGTVVADLSQLGLLAFQGEDTATFLQGQLTNDVRALHADAAQWNGLCSPKGRLLGNFLMWRQGDDTCLQLSGDLTAGILKRLSMFILRAKVKGRDASDETVRLVVSGPQAAAAVQAAMGALPDASMRTIAVANGWVVRVGADKFVLSIAPDQATTVWQTLRQSATPVGAPVWDWLRLNAGIPMIVAATQEQFVPQMVNYEVLGGVSFQKGCYTGQEIVARTQNLGRIKRRTARFRLPDGPPLPPLAGLTLEGTKVAEVVMSAPAGDSLELLAVTSLEAWGRALRAADGREAVPLALPYPVAGA